MSSSHTEADSKAVCPISSLHCVEWSKVGHESTVTHQVKVEPVDAPDVQVVRERQAVRGQLREQVQVEKERALPLPHRRRLLALLS